LAAILLTTSTQPFLTHRCRQGWCPASRENGKGCRERDPTVRDDDSCCAFVRTGVVAMQLLVLSLPFMSSLAFLGYTVAPSPPPALTVPPFVLHPFFVALRRAVCVYVGGGQEAQKVLDVNASASWEEITAKYEKLFDLNDKKKGGSFYLQSKVGFKHASYSYNLQPTHFSIPAICEVRTLAGVSLLPSLFNQSPMCVCACACASQARRCVHIRAHRSCPPIGMMLMVGLFRWQVYRAKEALENQRDIEAAAAPPSPPGSQGSASKGK